MPLRAYGATRSLAIYEDKVFIATTDARVYALDARTGKIVWQTSIADGKKGYSSTAGPIVIHGKVITGMTGCSQYREPAASSALTTPKRASNSGSSKHVAREGQPGGDTWGALPDILRAGGDTWITGSYDPVLNETYWGVSQPKPWLRVSRGRQAG